MTTFILEWGEGQTARVSDAEQLDSVLDAISANVNPGDDGVKVAILAEGRTLGPLPVALEITLGHPDRSSLLYLGPDGSGIGSDPTLPPWNGGPVWFDTNGVPTDYDADRLRLTPEQARAAAREYVTDDAHRPRSLEWDIAP